MLTLPTVPLQSSDSKPAGTRDALLDPTACQSFLAHPDAITCVCFVGEDRLVSTSAGDAVGVWRITAHAHGACQAGIIPPGQEPSLFSTSAAGGLPDTPPIAQLHRLHEPESSGHPGDGQKRAPILQSVSGCPSAAVQQSGYPAYAVQDAAQQSGCDAAGAEPSVAQISSAPLESIDPGAASAPVPASGKPGGFRRAGERAAACLQRITGFSGHVHHGMAWSHGMNLVGYGAGHVVVLEDLATRAQRYVTL